MQPTILPGQRVGENYHVFLGGEQDDPRAPVVLATDADNQFELLQRAYRDEREAGRVRPLALVGIGYGALYSKPGNRRFADYTPTSMSGEDGTGAAPAFRAWIDQDLRRWLAGRGLDRPRFGLAGHSLGALFGVYSFFHDESWVEACLAVAPSLWYDDRAMLAAQARHRERHARRPGRLVLAIGDDDSESMRGDLNTLRQRLEDEPYEDLEWVVQRHPGCDHYSAISPAFCQGLATLYPAH